MDTDETDSNPFDPMGIATYAHTGEPMDDLVLGLYILLSPFWIWVYALGWAYREYVHTDSNE